MRLPGNPFVVEDARDVVSKLSGPIKDVSELKVLVPESAEDVVSKLSRPTVDVVSELKVKVSDSAEEVSGPTIDVLKVLLSDKVEVSGSDKVAALDTSELQVETEIQVEIELQVEIALDIAKLKVETELEDREPAFVRYNSQQNNNTPTCSHCH